jgi:hypothetical protein
MPRLTKAELADHRAWLFDRRTTVDMAAYVFAVNERWARPVAATR